MKMKCLRSVCVVERMDGWRDEEVRKKISVTVDQKFLKWFGHEKRVS